MGRQKIDGLQRINITVTNANLQELDGIPGRDRSGKIRHLIHQADAGDKFRLDIYTWPAFCGVDAKIRMSEHDTVADAIAQLEAQTEPYAYATLQRKSRSGWEPCDWTGGKVFSNEIWPVRRGTNGYHPAYLAMVADWGNMLAMVREEHERTREGTLEIAFRILKQRHPLVYGWSESLGWQAVGGEPTSFMPDFPGKLDVRHENDS